MLSRPLTCSMPENAAGPDWDIFCNVIDNFGDIGVCWRLARQLVTEYGVAVRLWVDDLAAFRNICPEIDALRTIQMTQGVEIRLWARDFPEAIPGDVVVEAFACRLPDAFIDAMAARSRTPVWINLDYLSAEAWVEGCHVLPSPHPKLSLTKYFFFPGFGAGTGGLLRERDLETRRRQFVDSPAEQNVFWQGLGMPPPSRDCLNVSLFAYENPAMPDLLSVWARGSTPVCCLAPVTRTRPGIEVFAGRALQAGDIVRDGNLEIRLLPFVPQADYDKLLWSCDVNFVRGEDSFVRAQWAARPMVWQIYPQDDDAHRVKLTAFLDLYCADLSAAAASSVREMFFAWNDPVNSGSLSSERWLKWMKALPELRRHAVVWVNFLKKQDDLCASLMRFCRSKL